MTAAAVRPAVADALALQARACAQMGSPLYAAMLERAAGDYRQGGVTRAFFDADPARGRSSVPGIRLMAALHRCALDGSSPAMAAHYPSCGGDGDADAAWEAARACLELRVDRVAASYARTPQTNEPARSTLLLGGLLAIAARTRMPVRLFEIGASAGLNTRLDRYRYEGEGWSWGDPASPLTLRNRATGVPRHAGADLRIVERAACDLHPLDLTSPDDRLALRSFVWADQPERLQRLDDAIAAALPLPMRVETADMFDWIPRRVAPSEGCATAIVHSIVTEHLEDRERGALSAAIRAVAATARRSAPVAWLRLEGAGSWCETSVTLWPAHEEIVVARSDGHGQAIVWNGSA